MDFSVGTGPRRGATSGTGFLSGWALQAPRTACRCQRSASRRPHLWHSRQASLVRQVVTCNQPPLQAPAPSTSGHGGVQQTAPPRPPMRGSGGPGPQRGGVGRGGGGGPSRGGGGSRPPGTAPFQVGGRGGFSGSRGSSSSGRGGRGGNRGRYSNDGPRDGIIYNDAIPCEEVRLLGVEKEMLGVMSLMQAMDLAEVAETDVVLINPSGVPPVARLVQVSKYKFELAKAAKEASKKQREARQDMKELKLRPSTDVHDYQVRLRAAQKFLAKGDKVKLSLQFRGREIEMQSIGRDLFQKFVDDVGTEAAVASKPEMQGRIMSMILTPVKV